MAGERKTAMFAQFARVAKALASPVRMELVDLLAQAERSVEDLARAAGLPVGNTSAQLRILHAAGLTASRRDGTRVCYRLAGDDVAALYRAVRDTAHARLPDAQAASTAYLGSDTAGAGGADGRGEPVARGELLRRAQAGEVLVLDVRPAEEYAAGHIPGAVSVPLADLPARLDALPAGTEIVAYCRGAYCVLARDAARVLRASGRPARHLADGMLEWRLDGLPVEAA
jgi:rhodanese-related sulfurtransferase/DNA-binding transcriptional ArsR family regulator